MKTFLNILILTTIFLSISSCKVKQSVADVVIRDKTPTNITIETPKKEDKEIKTPATETIPSDTIIQTTVTGSTAFEYKNEYTVAIILPFFNDSLTSSYSNATKSDLSDFTIPKAALKSLNFIEGMILALENEHTANLKIEVFDNQGSHFQTTNILNKLSFQNIDFIIGPIYNKNIKLVSTFAKKNDIIMISPFSHSTNASSEYAKYIMPKPSLDIHLKNISTFIQTKFPNSNIKLLYPNKVKSEQFAFRLQKILSNINDTIQDVNKKLNYALIEVEANTNDRNDFKMEEYLDADVKNVVIVLPANTGFVHNMLTQLNQQLKDFDITVFGMPNWKDSKTLRLEYFNSLNVHFSDLKWIDKNDINTSDFISTFKEKYHFDPTDEAFLGYDIFNFLDLLLEKYGKSFPNNIHKETYKGVFGNYHFQHTKPSSLLDLINNKALRIENNSLHIISYKDFKLILEQ